MTQIVTSGGWRRAASIGIVPCMKTILVIACILLLGSDQAARTPSARSTIHAQ